MEREKDISKKIRFITIVLLSLCNFRFKSFRRFLIFAFHNSGFINVRDFASIDKITNERLVSVLDLIFHYKITKKELYKITDCSKNTFNKKLKDYLTEKNLNGRRKFSLEETYGIINEWQGEGKWGNMEAIKKEKLAKIYSNGNYKKIAEEFELKFGKSFYKNNDKFSPKEVKELLKHIDEIESKKSKEILGEEVEISGRMSIWFFAILIGVQFLKKRNYEVA